MSQSVPSSIAVVKQQSGFVLESTRQLRSKPKRRNVFYVDLLAVTAVIVVLVVVQVMLLTADEWWGESVQLSLKTRILLAIFATVACVGFALTIVYLRAVMDVVQQHQLQPPTAPEEFESCGVGAVSSESAPHQLYLDMVKRAVTNIIYQDESEFYYDRGKTLRADGFDLYRRTEGVDFPTKAHTMVGMRRLNNLQECIETVLREDIDGDIIESGALCGGASIFARAVLKAHGDTDRRVFVCDTFMPQPPSPPVFLFLIFWPMLWLAASIPSRWWQRRLFFILQQMQKSFPRCNDPSDDVVQFVMDMLRYPRVFHKLATSLDDVKSHFARYGLLDEQVVFLKGFFSDTMPTAPIEQLSVLRLDGDTYESTMDVLEPMYSKLASGGFCIVDDYCISDCRRAVNEYRAKHGIKDPITIIDQGGAYWRKSR